MERRVNPGKIREIRQSQGIEQAELARRAGISRSHMNKVERGVEKPKIETAVRIARGLGVDIDAIAPVIEVPA